MQECKVATGSATVLPQGRITIRDTDRAVLGIEPGDIVEYTVKVIKKKEE